VFTVRQYFDNGESVIQTQRDFRNHLDIPRHGTIPDRNIILRWVTAFNTIVTVVMRRINGRHRTIRTPENVNRIRLDTLWSPNSSVCLRTVVLGINESTVRPILKPELRCRRVCVRKVWFQQDGATSYTARASMEVLRKQFPGRLISRLGTFRASPRSPELTTCDFFLWGHLKSRVY